MTDIAMSMAQEQIKELRGTITQLQDDIHHLQCENERLRKLLEIVWGSGAVAGLSCEEQVRCALKPKSPTMQEISDEIEASEREFRPRRALEPKP